MGRNDYTADQVLAAIAFVELEAKDQAKGVSYTRTFEAAGMQAPQDLHAEGASEIVTVFMKDFHDTCIREKRPPLDALVVHVTGERRGRPGIGYFLVNRIPDPFSTNAKAEDVIKAFAFWKRQQEECKRWGDKQRRNIG